MFVMGGALLQSQDSGLLLLGQPHSLRSLVMQSGRAMGTAAAFFGSVSVVAPGVSGQSALIRTVCA